MTQRLRVVYIDHIARLSGGELALLRTLSALESNVEPLVILGEEGPLTDALTGIGVAWEVLPLSPSARDVQRTEVGAGRAAVVGAVHTAWYVVRLARRLRALRPDLVHTNSLKSGYYGSLAARLARVPVVWHVRDRIASDYMPAGVVRLTRLALRVLPNAIVCNSASTLATVAGDTDQIPLSRTTVIFDPYLPSAQVAPAVDGFVVGMVGRLAPWKGQELFIRAFAEAFPEGPAEARIVGSAMFGEDHYAASLRDLVSQLGMANRIRFTGFVEDVEEQLQAISVLVHASLTAEPFGQVVVEGLAAGLAVVAADEGGPAEVVTPDVDGLLFRSGDQSALAAALARLHDEPGLRSRLGAGGQARAADFRPEIIGPQFLECYQRVIATRGGRWPHQLAIGGAVFRRRVSATDSPVIGLDRAH